MCSRVKARIEAAGKRLESVQNQRERCDDSLLSPSLSSCGLGGAQLHAEVSVTLLEVVQMPHYSLSHVEF